MILLSELSEMFTFRIVGYVLNVLKSVMFAFRIPCDKNELCFWGCTVGKGVYVYINIKIVTIIERALCDWFLLLFL